MVEEIFAKHILNKHKQRDPWFLDEYSVNPYGSCDFACVYCYIHGSKYGSKKLMAKINAPQLLDKELARLSRRGRYGFIALSSATEAWMHIEGKYMLTRKCLGIIAKYRFPVHVLTKSTLILRDIDILRRIDKEAILPLDLRGRLNNGVLITFSFSTLNKKIAKIFEPNAPSPNQRLDAIQKLKEEGFCVGIAFIPILPYISDSNEELETLVRTAKNVDVNYIFFGNLTLHREGKKVYFAVLSKYFPELKEKYTRLYGSRFYPHRDYLNSLYKRAYFIARKYRIKVGILGNSK